VSAATGRGILDSCRNGRGTALESSAFARRLIRQYVSCLHNRHSHQSSDWSAAKADSTMLAHGWHSGRVGVCGDGIRGMLIALLLRSQNHPSPVSASIFASRISRYCVHTIQAQPHFAIQQVTCK
jgi:hypothetical protein